MFPKIFSHETGGELCSSSTPEFEPIKRFLYFHKILNFLWITWLDCTIMTMQISGIKLETNDWFHLNLYWKEARLINRNSPEQSNRLTKLSVYSQDDYGLFIYAIQCRALPRLAEVVVMQPPSSAPAQIRAPISAWVPSSLRIIY